MASRKKKKFKILWKKVLLLVIPILAFFGLCWFLIKINNPLVIKEPVYQLQIHQSFEPASNIDSIFMDSVENVQFSGDYDPETAGYYNVEYTYKGKSTPFTIQVGDFQGPVMKLKEISTDTAEDVTAGDFVESIEDDSNYSYKMELDKLSKDAGTYVVTITAVDNYGNTTTEKTKLVRKADQTAPEIQNFEDSITIRQGSDLSFHQYSVVDDMDPNPSYLVDSSEVDLKTPGTYTVHYKAQDRSGNVTEKDQTLVVEADPDYGKNVVYLTFDDGPSENTEKILSILQEQQVPATFFVTGNNPEYNDLMKKIVEQGSAVALHTYTHNYDTVYSSDEAYFDDLQKISDLVESETGIESKVIRFPGGSSNMVSKNTSEGIMTRLTQEVLQKGYQYFDWNVDSTDASGNNIPAAQIAENASAGVGLEHAVILMHDSQAKSTTVEALPQIIKAYKDAGYVFRPLDVLTPPVHHGVNN